LSIDSLLKKTWQVGTFIDAIIRSGGFYPIYKLSDFGRELSFSSEKGRFSFTQVERKHEF